MSNKIRDTVSRLVREIEDGMLVELSSKFESDLAKTLLADLKSALAEPIRNCDVGTPEEQSDRFLRFCAKYYPCINCPAFYELNNDTACWSTWEQMPYEEVK